MAHFSTLSSGKWRADVFKRGVRKGRSFKTKEEAEEWASALEKSIEESWNPEELGRFSSGVVFKGPDFSKTEIINGSSPMGKFSGVYFLIRKNEIVYVGKTTHLMRRLIQHINDGVEYDRYFTIRCGNDLADRLEKHYIKKFKPEKNKQFKCAA